MQNTYPSPYSSSHPNPTATCNLQCPIWPSTASTCELHIIWHYYANRTCSHTAVCSVGIGFININWMFFFYNCRNATTLSAMPIRISAHKVAPFPRALREAHLIVAFCHWHLFRLLHPATRSVSVDHRMSSHLVNMRAMVKLHRSSHQNEWDSL